ncbi:hypothetical protein LTR35_015689 [Friedmanniomyces endolithicus]|nr:hypothetical protein LTR35_015689 [Friedmanniomyces endolithicus]KAK0283951.1 hypothetical protein LTS00_011392 [Friedmanniomyces endolithicus]KAK0982199.1 hypothetical protein LTR54_014720 [Friedmanniomyces endolithicus]
MKSTLLRQVARASATPVRAPTFTAATRGPLNQTEKATNTPSSRARNFSNGAILKEKAPKDDADHNKHDEYSTSGKRGAFKHEGQHSRTDNRIKVEYPEEDNLPASKPVQGRGGYHFKRTLASFSLEGRVGVVTGGARGLGLVMSQALVVSGADVAIVDLNKEEAARQAEGLMKHFREENPGAENIPKVTAHYADVSSPESVNAAIAEIVADHGKIDNLVTSAGFTENFDAIQYPFDRMQKLWGVNVNGTYLFAIGVAKHLMERKAPGSVVFIGSMSGSIVNVPQPQALITRRRRRSGIWRVRWRWSGRTRGFGTKKILDDNPELANKWTSLIPQGKMGRPEDLMGAVTFLCSDASGYVTGADLRVDGGYTVT